MTLRKFFMEVDNNGYRKREKNLFNNGVPKKVCLASNTDPHYNRQK